MIISDMKEQAKELRIMAKERIVKYENECLEKEVRCVFEWILKVMKEKIKKTIEYDFIKKEYVFEQSFGIQENQTIVVEWLENKYLSEQLSIYKAEHVKDGLFKQAVKKAIDILDKVEGYTVRSDLTKNSFSISLIINIGELM